MLLAAATIVSKRRLERIRGMCVASLRRFEGKSSSDEYTGRDLEEKSIIVFAFTKPIFKNPKRFKTKD